MKFSEKYNSEKARDSHTCLLKRVFRLLSVLFLLVLSQLASRASLSPGDIAFTGYNSSVNYQFSFIATNTIAGGEVIYFSDRGYCNEKGSPGWTTSEGILKYTVPSGGLTIGDMIVIGNSGGWHIIQGAGSIINSKGSFELSTEGDQIFAFQTSNENDYPPTFISGIQMNRKTGSTDELWDNIDASNTSTNETDLPTTLTNGTNALRIYDPGEKDNAKYKNICTQGTQSEILAFVNNRSNWFMQDDTPFTLGYPATATTASAGDWNATTSWDANGIPGKTTNVTIQHNLTVTADCAINYGTLEAGAALTINSGKTLTGQGTLTLKSDASSSAALLGDGTYSGNVACQRYLAADRWYLASSPVSGQAIDAFLADVSNDISFKSGNYGMMDYNTTTDSWNSYFTAATTGEIAAGKGYALRRENEGSITFNGTVAGSTVTPAVNEGWNLVGNPYPTAIRANEATGSNDNFLSLNQNNLDPNYSAIYIWDEQINYTEGRNDYRVINQAGSFLNYLQSTQGFMIKTRPGISSISFAPSMRTSQTGIAFKSGSADWPACEIRASAGQQKTFTTLLFDNRMTPGLDVGFDAGAFNPGHRFFMYSRLANDNGIDFMVQCLPFPRDTGYIIALGIEITKAEVIQFSAGFSGNSAETDIILEDRLNGTVTNLKTDGYTTLVTESGIGRFFLHIGKDKLSKADEPIQRIQIIPDRIQEKIWVPGAIGNETLVSVFDITGKKILDTSLMGTDARINFTGKQAGIYIVKVKSGNQLLVQKIRW